jgi:hypothetical protein
MTTSVTEFVFAQPLFDNHDHHVRFKGFSAMKWSADHLIAYAGADLVTAAGPRPKPEEDMSKLDPMFPEVITQGVAKHLWPRIRNTGYAQAVNITCEELFGMPFEEETWPVISKKLQDLIADRSPAELYDEWIKEKCNIRWVIEDNVGFGNQVMPDQFPDYYRFTFRWDPLFTPAGPGLFQNIEKRADCSVTKLNDAVDGVNKVIDECAGSGKLAAFKIGMAYERSLQVSDPSVKDAETVFERIHKGKEITESERLLLGDYFFHRIMERADADDRPVQLHTGFLAGNWRFPEHARAALLVDIFQKYKKVRFDVFHGSFPYTAELGTLAKTFPNIWPDLCWVWAMSPAHAEQALYEWLDEIPYTRIFAFGGDTFFPPCTIGYTLQARTGIARVLERKTADKVFSESFAKEVAGAIMLENGETFYIKGT